MDEKTAEIRLQFTDNQWPLTTITHTRQIVRAMVVDRAENFYFVRVDRDDEFGKATLIETAGGGVEPGETHLDALCREMGEELGATVEILGKIGVVEDDYHLICRHNVNHYYLCRAVAFGAKNLTRDEVEQFHLSTLKLTYDQAVAEYEMRRNTPLGRLIARRELPILHRAKEMLDALKN